MTMEPVTLIIQERRRLIRSGLAALLAKVPLLDVVDVVGTDEELRGSVDANKPAAVVLELDPPWELRTLVSDLRAASAGVRIVAVHHGRLSDLGRRPVEAQVDALAAYGGGTSAIVAAILGQPAEASGHADRRRLPSRSILTPRECQILRLLANGMTAADCASALMVSPKTIDNHKQRIFAKLKVQNQAHAVALAHQIGLIGRSTFDDVASG